MTSQNRGQTMRSPNHRCGCEFGDDCTKTTMCYVQNVEDELDDEIERLTAEGRVMREYIYSQGLSDADIKLWITAASDRQTPPKSPRPHKPTGAPPGQPDEWGDAPDNTELDCQCTAPNPFKCGTKESPCECICHGL